MHSIPDDQQSYTGDIPGQSIEIVKNPRESVKSHLTTFQYMLENLKKGRVPLGDGSGKRRKISSKDIEVYLNDVDNFESDFGYLKRQRVESKYFNSVVAIEENLPKIRQQLNLAFDLSEELEGVKKASIVEFDRGNDAYYAHLKEASEGIAEMLEGFKENLG